jgi:hypothetical protein
MKGKTMSTWLMDTALFKMLQTAKARPLLEWCEANDASLFISVASVTHLARGISKLPGSQSQRAAAQRNWLDEIITRSSPTGSIQSTPRLPRRRARYCRA